MNIEKDKIQHFTASAIIAFLGALMMAVVGAGYIHCALGGFMASMGTGLGKEFGDKRAVGNHWCWWDLLADFLGAIVGALLGACMGIKEGMV